VRNFSEADTFCADTFCADTFCDHTFCTRIEIMFPKEETDGLLCGHLIEDLFAEEETDGWQCGNQLG